jgi:hypothetical protein
MMQIPKFLHLNVEDAIKHTIRVEASTLKC